MFLELLSERIYTFICGRTAVSKLKNSNNQNPLLLKDNTDGLQRTDSFETFAEIIEALICDFFTPVRNQQTNCMDKNDLPCKIQIDGL